jgi:hypothetical protein
MRTRPTYCSVRTLVVRTYFWPKAIRVLLGGLVVANTPALLWFFPAVVPAGLTLLLLVGMNSAVVWGVLLAWPLQYALGEARLSTFGVLPRRVAFTSGGWRMLLDTLLGGTGRDFSGQGPVFGGIDWAELFEVRLSKNGKQLLVETEKGWEFPLPLPHITTDPEGYIEFVERFAGEGHPLALTLRASWEERA